MKLNKLLRILSNFKISYILSTIILGLSILFQPLLVLELLTLYTKIILS